MSKVFTKDFTIALVIFTVIMAVACTVILLVNTQEASAPAVLETPTAEETNEEEMKVQVQKYETKEPLNCTRWVQYIPINGMLYPIYHTSCK